MIAVPKLANEAAERACQEAIQGRLGEAKGLLSTVATGGPTDSLDPGWVLVLRTLLWLADPQNNSGPAPQELAGVHPVLASATCTWLELAAVLAFDKQALVRILQIHSELNKAPEMTEAAHLELESGELWLTLLNGPGEDAAARAEQLADRAQQLQLPTMVIRFTCQRALLLMEREFEHGTQVAQSAIQEATLVARRASRMARSETLIFEEYLANLVLARVRRHGGQPHLAARILTALAQVVPPAFWRWLEWERVLAGGTTKPDANPGNPGNPGEHPLRSLFDAAERGDRAAFEQARAVAALWVTGWRSLSRELSVLIELVDPQQTPADTSAALPFCRGTRAEAPMGLLGPLHAWQGPLSATTAARSPAVGPLVITGPDSTARRVLSVGLGLTDTSKSWVAPQARQSDHRPHAVIAALALSGHDGTPVEELFRTVYGFAFHPLKHDGVLRVVLHRAREELGQAGEIIREGTVLRLIPKQPLVVPDPRCQRPIEERVLLRLAERDGRATARELAQSLQIPLRTVQRALGTLQEDGACTTERVGRSVEYQLEDTTFYQPSLHRLKPST